MPALRSRLSIAAGTGYARAVAVTALEHDEDVIVFDAAAPEAAVAFHAVDDRVMGGGSRSEVVRAPSGTLVFRGRVSLENGGGFASVRSERLVAPWAAASSLRLSVRGDGKRYKISLRTGVDFDGVLYQQAFVAPAGEWTEVILPFSRFEATFRGARTPGAPPLAPGAVRSIGFVIGDRQAGDFRLEIRCIAAQARARRAPDSR